MKRALLFSFILVSLAGASVNARTKNIKTTQTFQKKYEIYTTQNIYNFLVLNSKNGEVRQCQWGEYGFCKTINPSPRARYRISLGKKKPGRFKLVKTQNMWTFIMLDRVFGKVYHVQFSTKGDDYRFIKELL